MTPQDVGQRYPFAASSFFLLTGNYQGFLVFFLILFSIDLNSDYSFKMSLYQAISHIEILSCANL